MQTQPPVILIVDDEPDMLDILGRLIARCAPSVELVMTASGSAALTIVAERPVALVIADYHMPKMNGMQLTRQLKAVSPSTHVAITSVDDQGDVALQAKAVGADDVLPKPFELNQLKQLIEAHIPASRGDV